VPVTEHDADLGTTVSAASDVAVIIAAYNAEATLSDALASVAMQSAQPGSVVVVDDGSDDGTVRIAKGWQDRLPIRLVSHQANKGLARTRRSAIAASSEPLIAILDADDVWLPDHLGLMRQLYRDRPGLITADALKWMPEQGVSRTTMRASRSIPELRRQRTAILVENFVFIGTLFARETYSSLGGFRDAILGAEDWDLWIRMARAGVPISGTPYPTVLYRIHRGALSQGKQQLENEARVLELALTEVSRPDERAAAKRGLRTLRARLSLVRAYEHARRGASGAARTAALSALGGPRPVALRAATMLLAPGASVRFRDRHSWLPPVRLGR
jgi:glycosyltransferase involved in cell wall biosynthesis